MGETATKPEVKQCEKDIGPCPDYDSECSDVTDPLECFLGGICPCKNGQSYYIPMSIGYCMEMENRKKVYNG